MRLYKRFLSALLVLTSFAAFAAEKIPVNESMGGVNSWQKEYELTEDMKGKYNVLVTAKDSAGNVKQTDAFNIYIDKESDMPKVSVTNPSLDMVVPGNLNIVGTASDDDDVDSVCLIFDGDSDNAVKATGTKFWSYTLNTSTLEEGVHSLEVYAVDINGLEGHHTSVNWVLNRKVPEIEITSHSMGQIVHDKVTLEGHVSDGNGIALLEYSFDKGKTYRSAGIKKNAVSASFKISLDTKKVSDGATMCYIRAYDTAGSVSTYVFFFYVDNSKPDVRIISPLETDVLNGRFVVTGYAKDTVGLSSLIWKFAGQTGDIELVPGSNYWVVELDGTGLSGSSNFEIIATDSVKNVVSVKRSLKFDNSKDIPVACITYFDKDYLRGYAADDDGIAQISYVFDKDEEVTFDSNGAFAVKFDKELDYGRHTVTLYATDIYGLKSKSVTSSFTIEKPKEPKKKPPKKDENGNIIEEEPPVINLAPQAVITSPAPGSWIKTGFTLSGSVSDDVGVAKTEYCLDDDLMTWIPLTVDAGGNFNINIDVSDASAYKDGYIPVTVRVTDNNEENPLTSYAVSCVKKDCTAPVVTRLTPEAGVGVNGKFLIAFKVQDDNQIQKISYVNASGKTVDLDSSLYGLDTPYILVGGEDYPYSNAIKFIFTDINGNQSTYSSWSNINYDTQSDRPVISFNVPEDNQVVTSDFTVSGIATDDDGACHIYYSIDNGPYKLYSSDYVSSYNFKLNIAELKDNEHTISVYAEDLNGLKGDVITRKVRVSTSEPSGAMTLPLLTSSLRDYVTLSGNSSDANGIDRVMISLDNGVTYNTASGTTSWSYTFDSNVIQDGTHAVFIRVYDKYGISSMFSSMITIDNTCPEITLDYPLDGTTVTSKLNIVGRVSDAIGLADAVIYLKSFSNASIPAGLRSINLNPDAAIVSQELDLSSLTDGEYNIEIVCTDRAGNVTKVSRNFTLDKTAIVSSVNILYPMPETDVNHIFNIYGQAVFMNENIAGVDLYIDGKINPAIERSGTITDGYYKFTVNGEEASLSEGRHTFRVVETSLSGKTVSSEESSFIYHAAGPWVTLDNFVYGDFAVERPIIKGYAGYTLTEEEIVDSSLAKGKKPVKVYASFDNGKSYEELTLKSSGMWSYRIENLDIPGGLHYMLIKAVMGDGSETVTRLTFQVDRNAPDIKIITPVEGNHYNQVIEYSGIASDDVALSDVNIQLRKGDKNNYQLPGFIQGLYIDTSVWGASLYSVGVGLTAFDGAVKVQGQFGQFTREQWAFVYGLLGLTQESFRYGGNIIGGKIIAQLADIPFMYFWGRDFEWLSATAAIGANFSYFTESGANKGQMLSAIIGQIEFPKAVIKSNKYFKTWAVYYEPQVWFISSDVSSDTARKIVPNFSVGLRTSVF